MNTISRTANAAEQRPYGWALPDGSRLVTPTPLGPTELQLRQWVCVNGRVFRIVNMRAIGVSGRLVELSGRAPVYLRAGETLTGFEVAPPSVEDFPAVPAPDLAPARPKRRRASPGAGRTAPGRR